jgi:PLD-like domain
MSELVRFLYGEAIRASVEAVMDASSPPLDIAVAYWSEGGLPQLTSPQWNKETRIICDLMSGFCKVALIRTLRANQRIHVKKRHNLHAKVYLGTTSVVIGSANASGAGLDATTQSKQEAAVLVTEGAALLQAHDWFQLMWEYAEDISEADLTKAEAIEQAAKLGAKAIHDMQPPQPQLDPNDDRQFLDSLTAAAYEAVMQFARNTPDAVQVRFGKLGGGRQPNFTLIYSNASKHSFRFPGENGDAWKPTREWNDRNLTRPFDVKH